MGTADPDSDPSESSLLPYFAHWLLNRITRVRRNIMKFLWLSDFE